MKKGILICSILLVASISTVFAKGNGDINHSVLNSFKQEFATAEVINWENSNDYIKLTFRLNDLIMFAYYTKNAELIAVSRNILSNQLPLHLLRSLKKNYNGYWITDLFEMDGNSDTGYFVRMENSDSVIVLRSLDSSNCGIYKKEKKNVE
jgi:hypothetical protein